jgi:hypothetical protein
MDDDIANQRPDGKKNDSNGKIKQIDGHGSLPANGGAAVASLGSPPSFFDGWRPARRRILPGPLSRH